MLIKVKDKEGKPLLINTSHVVTVENYNALGNTMKSKITTMLPNRGGETLFSGNTAEEIYDMEANAYIPEINQEAPKSTVMDTEIIEKLVDICRERGVAQLSTELFSITLKPDKVIVGPSKKTVKKAEKTVSTGN